MLVCNVVEDKYRTLPIGAVQLRGHLGKLLEEVVFALSIRGRPLDGQAYSCGNAKYNSGFQS